MDMAQAQVSEIGPFKCIFIFTTLHFSPSMLGINRRTSLHLTNNLIILGLQKKKLYQFMSVYGLANDANRKQGHRYVHE